MTHERRLPGVASLAAGAGDSDFDEGIVMTEPDAALLWAREQIKVDQAAKYHADIDAGQWDNWRVLITFARSYRAGQQSAEARVAELEAENARLREAASEMAEELLWDAYNAGFESAGTWAAGGMSSAEWLLSITGLSNDRHEAKVVHAAISKAIPKAVAEYMANTRAALAGGDV